MQRAQLQQSALQQEQDGRHRVASVFGGGKERGIDAEHFGFGRGGDGDEVAHRRGGHEDDL